MELTHELTPHLKRLRLSGVLETLELRNQQAIQERLSYIEFLARLIQDEVERRTQKQLQLRLRRAAFRSDKTLESFDFSFPGLSGQDRQSDHQSAAGARPGHLYLRRRASQRADLRADRGGQEPFEPGVGA